MDTNPKMYSCAHCGNVSVTPYVPENGLCDTCLRKKEEAEELGCSFDNLAREEERLRIKYTEHVTHVYKLNPSMVGEMLIGNEEVLEIIKKKLADEFFALSHGTIVLNNIYWKDEKLIVEFV